MSNCPNCKEELIVFDRVPTVTTGINATHFNVKTVYKCPQCKRFYYKHTQYEPLEKLDD